MSAIHPHTKALGELLLALVAQFEPSHSGNCIDFKQEHWPVTEESCTCNPAAKRLRRAIREARATLDYDAAPVALCAEFERENARLREAGWRVAKALECARGHGYQGGGPALAEWAAYFPKSDSALPNV
jgi:hypothetical protein